MRERVLSLQRGPRATASRTGLAVVCIALGCAAPQRRFVPPSDPSQMDDTAFTHYLATVPVVTVAEGWRAILILRGSRVTGWTLAEQRLELERLGAVQPRWRLQPGQVLDKGTLGYMLAAVCELPPGVDDRWARVLGIGERRYALKSCIDEGILPYDVERSPVMGGELLAAISQAETCIVKLGENPVQAP